MIKMNMNEIIMAKIKIIMENLNLAQINMNEKIMAKIKMV